MIERLTKEQRAQYMRDNGVAPKPWNAEYEKRREQERLAEPVRERCYWCGWQSPVLPLAEARVLYAAHAKAGCR